MSFPTGQEPIIQGRLSIKPGNAKTFAGDPSQYIDLVNNGKVIGQLSADQHNGDRWRAMLALIPTAYTRGEKRRAESGTWKIDIIRALEADKLTKAQLIDVWVQRDDDPANMGTGAKQSYLVDFACPYPPKERVDKSPYKLDLITGFGSMNAIASSPNTTRVGGYIYNTGRPSDYSSSGGVYLNNNNIAMFRPGHRQVDLMAVADQSRLRLGTPSIGVYSGSTSRFVGTSVAAPAVVRLAAINAAKNISLFDGIKPVLGGAIDEFPTQITIAREKPSSRVKPVTRK